MSLAFWTFEECRCDLLLSTELGVFRGDKDRVGPHGLCAGSDFMETATAIPFAGLRAADRREGIDSFTGSNFFWLSDNMD